MEQPRSEPGAPVLPGGGQSFHTGIPRATNDGPASGTGDGMRTEAAAAKASAAHAENMLLVRAR